MDTLSITKNIMRQNAIVAKKSLGQNFLIDDNVLEDIVNAGEIGIEDTVIEIGPGIGNLTEYLLKTGADTIVFEIDEKMKDILHARFSGKNNLQIQMQDILKADITPYLKNIKGKVKVIANLPYYITTPIIFKLLEYADKIDRIVIMIQKEVADRLIAKPKTKDYGVLTVNVNYKADAIKIFDVPKESFIPSPNVTSSVVLIKPNENKKKEYNVVNEKIFASVVKAGFATRRKKLINSLCIAQNIGIDKDQIIQIANKIKLNENTRIEECSIEEIAILSNEIAKAIE